jgi:hypothetical protein
MTEDVFRLEGRVAGTIVDIVGDRVTSNRLNGLAWSPNMPDDDPDADFLVVDAEGREFVLGVDVTLTPVGQAAGVTRKA